MPPDPKHASKHASSCVSHTCFTRAIFNIIFCPPSSVISQKAPLAEFSKLNSDDCFGAFIEVISMVASLISMGFTLYCDI